MGIIEILFLGAVSTFILGIILGLIGSNRLRKYFSEFSKNINQDNEVIQAISSRLLEKYEKNLEKVVTGVILCPAIIQTIIALKNKDNASSSTAIILIIVGICFEIILALDWSSPNSSFIKKVFKEFTCPKCKKEFCWLIKKSFDTNRRQYTTHERKEEKDSKGNIHIVYIPINHTYYKHHDIYHCKQCQYKEEIVTEHTD